MSETRASQPARLAFLLLAGVAPPVAGLAIFGVPAEANLTLALTALGVYEVLLVALGIAGSIFTDLQGRWTSRLTDHLDSALQRRFSRFRRRYIRYLATSSKHVDVRGLQTLGDYTFTLEQVFVRLRLDRSLTHSLSKNPVELTSANRTGVKDVWHWIEEVRAEHVPLAIIGPPGSGKTTLLKHICYSAATNRASRQHRRTRSRQVPILVELRSQQSLFLETKLPTLVEVLRSAIPEDLREPPKWFEKQLRAGNVVVLLDGIDEISDDITRRTLTTWVNKQQQLYQTTLFVLTSRPFGYEENPIEVATVVEALPFTTDQIDEFLDRWYLATCIRRFDGDNSSARAAARRGSSDLRKRLNRTQALRDLAVNPLLLTMLANVHEYRDALPGSRAELYKEVCEVFLGKRQQLRGLEISMTAPKKQLILESLAYQMMLAERHEVTLEEASGHIGQVLSRVASGHSSDEFMRQVEESSGLLVELESGTFAFAHPTFQEYLAAIHIRSNSGPANSDLIAHLCSRVADSWWSEVIRLYVAQGDATPVLQALLDIGNLSPTQIAFAIECLSESREVDSTVRERVEMLVNSAELRFDPAARLEASKASLIVGLRESVRLSDTESLILRPVTCLQYQSFIDSTATQAPIHWFEQIFPLGAGHGPAGGMTPRDAADCVQWISSVLDDGATYRLPSGDELATLAETRVPGEDVRANLFNSFVEDSVGLRCFSVGGRARDVGDVVYFVSRQVSADVSVFADRYIHLSADRSQQSGRVRVYGRDTLAQVIGQKDFKDFATAFGSSPLQGQASVSSSLRAIDRDTISNQVKAVKREVEIDIESWERPGPVDARQIKDLVIGLERAIEAWIGDRQRNGKEDSHGFRAMARLATLAIAWLSSRRDPGPIALQLYFMLSLIEARIEDALSPDEGIFVVRVVSAIAPAA